MIHQFAAVLREHDAVAGEAAALHEMFLERRVSAALYAETPGSLYGHQVRDFHALQPAENDTVLVHYSHGSATFDPLFALPGKKVVLYHRITPASALRGISRAQAEASDAGEKDLHRFARFAFASVAHAKEGAAELAAAGYRNPAVIPYFLYEPMYKALPASIENNTGSRVIAVVGRVMPHKGIEDAILVLRALRAEHGPDWRLIVAGDPAGAEAYLERLAVWAEEAGVGDNVTFTGRVSQAELLGIYSSAAVLLFPSRHEGFGVPLVEAMRFGVPVVARRSPAAVETAGSAALFYLEEPPEVIAGWIARIAADQPWRETLLAAQRQRLEHLSPQRVRVQWLDLLELT